MILIDRTVGFLLIVNGEGGVGVLRYICAMDFTLFEIHADDGNTPWKDETTRFHGVELGENVLSDFCVRV